MRTRTRVLSSECPPRAKKSSCTPTLSTSRTSAQTAATTRSVAVRGARYAISSLRLESGVGSEPLSIFPLGVCGKASRKT